MRIGWSVVCSGVHIRYIDSLADSLASVVLWFFLSSIVETARTGVSSRGPVCQAESSAFGSRFDSWAYRALSPTAIDCQSPTRFFPIYRVEPPLSIFHRVDMYVQRMTASFFYFYLWAILWTFFFISPSVAYQSFLSPIHRQRVSRFLFQIHFWP